VTRTRVSAAIALILIGAAAASAQEADPGAPPSLVPDAPIVCDSCVAWNTPQEPFRIFGNTYYVGTAQLSAILIASEDGLILLDGALPQSAPLIAANIEALGFRLADLRLIVNSHAHYDHAGGLGALARASGAEVAASAAGAAALERGQPTDDDPQAAFENDSFPPVGSVRAVADGETLEVGGVAVTAHLTPGHTPGSTSWTWDSCEAERCLHMVYADSLTAVSAPGFRFTGDAGHESRVEQFRASIAKVSSLPCDVLMTPHPGASGMDAKIAARLADPASNPFIDEGACAAYAAAASAGLERRIAQEGAGGG
jgi:metallo-beta-lactamase class B